jgi:beta-glucanase (GH16 family)
VVFQPGETEQDVAIAILGDTLFEKDEYFTITLSALSGATVTRTLIKGTILNDDQANPVVIPKTGYTTPLSYPGRTLVWQDEFNGTTIGDWWTFETGNGQSGWGNHELEYYRQENASLLNGYLIIEARKESFGGFDYTSSRMVTKGKKEFTFGRIDIRAALPSGQGMWPALWMLGANIDQVSWPACGELDIMEVLGQQPDKLYGTAHFGVDYMHHLQSGDATTLTSGDDFHKQFHVFSLDWQQDHIRWYVDDVLYHEITPASIAPANWPFNLPAFFIFNVAVGGDWPGGPGGATTFPNQMIVDYVRVFQ